MKIEDLDVLRPEARMLRIGGKDIDVSFIPCGITFEVDAIVGRLQTMDVEKMTATSEETKEAFQLSVRLCSLFCSRKYPELNEEWFMDNADAQQIKLFSAAIKDALQRAYAGVGTSNSKNVGAPKKRRR
jgi:hypothetical protein